MNDYYKIEVTATPSSTDALDLLASELADRGFESFEPSEDGSAMTAYVPAALYKAEAVDEAVAEVPLEVALAWKAEFVEGQDWNSEWEKNYFKPIVVDGRVVVHSTFHTDVPEAEYDITIDPRMAFGTGHHATTTLMMRSLLDGGDVEGASVIDMGTGTGILAILAMMLGAKEAVGIEIDPYAAENARDNVALNLPEASPLKIITGDASALANYEASADVFLANINRNIITADIARYAGAMKKDARITVSGFYVEDRPVVARAAGEAGLEMVAADEMNNWSSMTFRKK